MDRIRRICVYLRLRLNLGIKLMYSVEADGSKRLVVISAAGHVTTEEVKAAAQELRELVKDAAPGFRVLTDFRWLESMEPAAASQAPPFRLWRA